MTDMKYTPQRGGPESMNDRQIPWTEQIAKHRPRAPIRRLSASEETRSFGNSAGRQQSAFADGTLEGYEGSAKLFGFPAAVTQSAKISDALELDLEAEPIEDKNGASTFVGRGSNNNILKARSMGEIPLSFRWNTMLTLISVARRLSKPV